MTIVNGVTFNNVVNGTSYNESLTGTTGNDILYGKGGHDTLNGGNGNDVDVLVGGSGDDRLEGSIGVDWVFINDPNLTITPFGSTVYVSSSEGVDTITNFNPGEGDAIYRVLPGVSSPNPTPTPNTDPYVSGSGGVGPSTGYELIFGGNLTSPPIIRYGSVGLERIISSPSILNNRLINPSTINLLIDPVAPITNPINSLNLGTGILG